VSEDDGDEMAEDDRPTGAAGSEYKQT